MFTTDAIVKEMKDALKGDPKNCSALWSALWYNSSTENW